MVELIACISTPLKQPTLILQRVGSPKSVLVMVAEITVRKCLFASVGESMTQGRTVFISLPLVGFKFIKKY